MEHQLQDAISVVTGASSGIGSAVVRDLLAAGAIVVALARRVDRLEELLQNLTDAEQHQRLHLFKCDVGDAGDVANVFGEIAQKVGPIRVLVNNAGCLRSGKLCSMEAESVQQVLQTNVMGVVNCTRHAFKAMQMHQEQLGHVILINSILGHAVPAFPGHFPSLNIYAATKHAVTAINEIYRQEFRQLGTNVKVTSISPGLVDTELITDEQKGVCQGRILQPQDVSRAVMFALTSPQHVQIYEVIIKPAGDMI